MPSGTDSANNYFHNSKILICKCWCEPNYKTKLMWAGNLYLNFIINFVKEVIFKVMIKTRGSQPNPFFVTYEPHHTQ